MEQLGLVSGKISIESEMSNLEDILEPLSSQSISIEPLVSSSWKMLVRFSKILQSRLRLKASSHARVPSLGHGCLV